MSEGQSHRAAIGGGTEDRPDPDPDPGSEGWEATAGESAGATASERLAAMWNDEVEGGDSVDRLAATLAGLEVSDDDARSSTRNQHGTAEDRQTRPSLVGRLESVDEVNAHRQARERADEAEVPQRHENAHRDVAAERQPGRAEGLQRQVNDRGDEALEEQRHWSEAPKSQPIDTDDEEERRFKEEFMNLVRESIRAELADGITRKQRWAMALGKGPAPTDLDERAAAPRAAEGAGMQTPAPTRRSRGQRWHASPSALSTLDEAGAQGRVQVLQAGLTPPTLKEGFLMEDLRAFAEEYALYHRKACAVGQAPQGIAETLPRGVLSDLAGMINARNVGDEQYCPITPSEVRVAEIDYLLRMHGGVDSQGRAIQKIANSFDALARSILRQRQDPTARLGRLLGRLEVLAHDSSLHYPPGSGVLEVLSNSGKVNAQLRRQLVDALPDGWRELVETEVIARGSDTFAEVFAVCRDIARDLWDKVWLAGADGFAKQKKSPGETSSQPKSSDGGSGSNGKVRGKGKSRGNHDGGGGGKQQDQAKGGTSRSGGGKKSPGKAAPQRKVKQVAGTTCGGCGAAGHPFFIREDGRRVKNCDKFVDKAKFSELIEQWKRAESASTRRVVTDNQKVVIDPAHLQRAKVPIYFFSNMQEDLNFGDKRKAEYGCVLVDSGADMSIMPDRVLAKLRQELGDLRVSRPSATDGTAITTADGRRHAVVGVITLTLSIDLGLAPLGSLIRCRFLVPDGDTYDSKEVLLGQDVLDAAGIPSLLETLGDAAHRASNGQVLDATVAASSLADAERTAATHRVALRNVVGDDESHGAGTGQDVVEPASGDFEPHPVLGKQLPMLEDPDDDEIFQDDQGIPSSLDAPDAVALQAAIDGIRDRAIAEGLPPSAVPRLEHLLEEYREVFTLGFNSSMLPADTEPWVEPYDPDALRRYQERVRGMPARKYSKQAMQFMDQHTAMLVEAGMLIPLEDANLPDDAPRVFAPAVCTRKKDGSFRLAFDLRPANAIIQPIFFPCPDAEDTLDRVLESGATIYASYDLTKAFWQVPLAERSRGLFVCQTVDVNGRARLWLPTRVLQGGRNATVAMAVFLNSVLEDLEENLPLSRFVDDLLLGSKDVDRHLDGVEDILRAFKQRHVYVSPKKTHLFTKSCEFLGYRISDGLRHVLPERISFVQSFPPPQTLERLSSFIGVVNWISGSIPGFHELVGPLQDLKRQRLKGLRSKRAEAMKRVPLKGHWLDEHQAAFEALKEAVARSVSLSVLHEEDAALLYVDASESGFAWALLAADPAELEKPHLQRVVRPVVFGGRRWRGAEQSYSVPRKECLAARDAVMKNERRLYRKHGFVLYSDHQNLLTAINSIYGGTQSRVVTGQLSRTAAYLTSIGNGYFAHVSSQDNLLADWMSRVGEDDLVPETATPTVRGIVVDLAEEAPAPPTRTDGLDPGDGLGDFETPGAHQTFVVGDREYGYGRGFRPAELDESAVLPNPLGQRYNLRRRRAPAGAGSATGSNPVVEPLEPDEPEVRHGENGASEEPGTRPGTRPDGTRPNGTRPDGTRPDTRQESESDSSATAPLGAGPMGAVEGPELVVNQDGITRPMSEYDAVLDLQVPIASYNQARASVLKKEGFQFPSMHQLREAQQRWQQAVTNGEVRRPQTANLPEHLANLTDELELDEEGDIRTINGLVARVVDGVIEVKRGSEWRLFIPVSEDEYHVRVLVELHSAGCHRRLAAMETAFDRVFVMAGSSAWMKFLIDRCLNCLTARHGSKIPRPMGNTVVAERPNEVLLVDFLKVYHPRPQTGVGVGGGVAMPYLLVMRDAFSLFTQLHPAPAASAAEAAAGILGWCTAYGVPKCLRSDHGSHFDNHVHEVLADCLSMESAFSVPRYPQSNGRAERAVQSVVSTLRSAISEAQLGHEQYVRLLPLVTLTMNEAPSATLGGISPHQAFFGRKERPPLERFVLLQEDGHPFRTVEITEPLRQRVLEFSEQVEELHRETFAIHEHRNARARERHNSRRHLDPLKLQIGDYVVYRWFSKTASKMAHRWLGPARVVALESGSCFLVEDLLTGSRFSVAAPHVAFYSNVLLETEVQELKRVMAFERYSHQVGTLESLALGEDGKWNVTVRYRGFQPDDPTGVGLEPLVPLFRNLPRTVVRFLKRLRNEGKADLVNAALSELGESSAILDL
ncbi:Pol polyprotein [Cleaved into: Reverse transcriptase/ribonuclease H (RT) [Durusdinium trenchii]|uniref:Pol polyprotein [Cleaved into: Reverse transcriptase/ribonuclease H (RT) n=1 Tax=Durusdinium trenchii TaxID=1381693 RepID=A0ABP0IME4_9DINO